MVTPDEVRDEVNARADEILDLLDDVSASLENVMLVFGQFMHAGDRVSRTELVNRARALCDELLRSEDDAEEDED